MTIYDWEKLYIEKGWLKDSNNLRWISPKGRIADYPGGPFYGQVSKRELASLKKETAGSNNTYVVKPGETITITF